MQVLVFQTAGHYVQLQDHQPSSSSSCAHHNQQQANSIQHSSHGFSRHGISLNSSSICSLLLSTSKQSFKHQQTNSNHHTWASFLEKITGFIMAGFSSMVHGVFKQASTTSNNMIRPSIQQPGIEILHATWAITIANLYKNMISGKARVYHGRVYHSMFKHHTDNFKQTQSTAIQKDFHGQG